MNSKTNIIKAAIRTPDQGVSIPEQRVREGSFASSVSALDVGESVSRIHTLNEDMTLKELREELRDIKAMVRSNVTPAVTAAKKRTGGSYSIEVSETITPGANVYLVAIITRTE